jgi:phenylalanyl-tRNA synthetase beta chain
MHEVHSYIWSDSKKNEELGIATPENVKIINAQTPDHTCLRVSMIPTLLSFVKENKSYSDSFGIFEIGHTVEGLRADGYCNEQNKLGAVFFSKTDSEEALFLKARDAVAEICGDILHKDARFESADADFDFEHPVNSFNITLDGEKVGYLSVPHPTVCENIDKKCAVAFFEIWTERFAKVKALTTKYAEPSKFPAIDIDITFNTDIGAVDFVALTERASAAAGGLLSDVKMKDIYTQDGASALTLRFSFSSDERTLTKQELAPVTDAVISALAEMNLSLKQ